MTSRELQNYTSRLTPYQLDQIKAQILRYLVLNDELEDTAPECCPYCKDATAMTVFRFPYALMIGALVGLTALIPVAGAYIGAGVGAF